MMRTMYQEDPNVSYQINKNRRLEYTAQQYDHYVQENEKMRQYSLFASQLRPVQQISKRWFSIKINQRVNQSRTKLLKIFRSEFDDYQRALKMLKPTDDDLMHQLEEKVAVIQKQKQSVKTEFNKKMDTIIDEKRDPRYTESKYLVNQQLCVAQWGKMRFDKMKREALERDVQSRIDQLAITDYKNYLIEREQERVMLKNRINANKAALDQQLDEKDQQDAQLAAEKRKEHEESLMNQEINNELRKLESSYQHQQKAFMRRELEIQVQLQNLRSERRQREDSDFDAAVKLKAENEAHAEAQRMLEKKQRLYDEQLIYVELIRKRREKLAEIAAAEDALYVKMMVERDRTAQNRDDQFHTKQRQLAKGCYDFNATMPSKDQQAQKEAIQKRKELEEALRELHEYEEDKLSELRNHLLQQRVMREVYEADIAERAQDEKDREAKKLFEERNEIEGNQKQEEQYQRRVKEIYDNMQEAQNVFAMIPEAKKKTGRQWYNQ